jgi:PRC-barrel domain
MRATDLLGVSVYDSRGREVGKVRDLRFEAGVRAVVDSGRPAYRLIEIECGPVGIPHRLGYGHRDLAGPWPLDRILALLARRSLIVHWDQIGTIDGDRLELTVLASELRHLGDEGDD